MTVLLNVERKEADIKPMSGRSISRGNPSPRRDPDRTRDFHFGRDRYLTASHDSNHCGTVPSQPRLRLPRPWPNHFPQDDLQGRLLFLSATERDRFNRLARHYSQ